MYDIYLSSGFRTLPDFGELETEVRPLLRENLQNRVPGFLGLDVPAETAAELLESLNQAGGGGLVVPVAYRQPKVTCDLARPIAEKEIVKKERELFPTYTFEPISFFDEGAMWWKFGAISEKLIQEGRAPGSVAVWVDKLDGHVWTGLEQVRLYGEEYSLELATTREPMQLLQLLSENLDCAQEAMEKTVEETSICLRLSPGFTVSAARHTFPEFVAKQFGVFPTTNLLFKITPYKKGYESVHSLLRRAVKILLQYDPGDVALTFDGGDEVRVLKRIAGTLIAPQDWRSWIGELTGEEAIASFAASFISSENAIAPIHR